MNPIPPPGEPVRPSFFHEAGEDVEKHRQALGYKSDFGTYKHDNFSKVCHLLSRTNEGFCNMLDGFDKKTSEFEHNNHHFCHELDAATCSAHQHDHQFQHYLGEEALHQQQLLAHSAEQAAHTAQMAQYNVQKAHHDREMAHAMSEFRKWYAASDPRHLRQKGYRLTHLATVGADGVPIRGSAQLGQFARPDGVPITQTSAWTAISGVPIPPAHSVSNPVVQGHSHHHGHNSRHAAHHAPSHTLIGVPAYTVSPVAGSYVTPGGPMMMPLQPVCGPVSVSGCGGATYCPPHC